MTDESKSKKPKLVEARSRNEIDHEEFEMDADFDGENDDVIITPNPVRTVTLVMNAVKCAVYSSVCPNC